MASSPRATSRHALLLPVTESLGFPGGSDGKESTCNEGDLGSIPGWEDPLEEVLGTRSSILPWRIPMDREAWWTTVPGIAKSQTQLSEMQAHAHLCARVRTHTHTSTRTLLGKAKSFVSDPEVLALTQMYQANLLACKKGKTSDSS